MHSLHEHIHYTMRVECSLHACNGSLPTQPPPCTPPPQALGYEDLVRPGVLLSASNLQVQPPSGQSTIRSLQARDVSVFSQSPRDQHLSDALHHLRGALPVSMLVGHAHHTTDCACNVNMLYAGAKAVSLCMHMHTIHACMHARMHTHTRAHTHTHTHTSMVCT